jgi:hypothetical protein
MVGAKAPALENKEVPDILGRLQHREKEDGKMKV